MVLVAVGLPHHLLVLGAHSFVPVASVVPAVFAAFDFAASDVDAVVASVSIAAARIVADHSPSCLPSLDLR